LLGFASFSQIALIAFLVSSNASKTNQNQGAHICVVCLDSRQRIGPCRVGLCVDMCAEDAASPCCYCRQRISPVI
jgi:hypothetical protein